MVEGGARVLQGFLEQGLVDEMVVTISPCFIGGYRMWGSEGKGKQQQVRIDVTAVLRGGEDIIVIGRPLPPGPGLTSSVGCGGCRSSTCSSSSPLPSSSNTAPPTQ